MQRVATLAFLLYIAYLFWADVRSRGERRISWVPLIWMFLAGSRWVSSWFSLSVPLASADDYAEGSPVDRAVFLGLIIAGVIVLFRRKIDWGQLFSKNKWLALYLLYCLSSVFWTDEPFVLIKRWIKDLGNPIMALVILTEDSPYEAVGITLRRLAFLLLPLSVLFVRYIPELGRTYHNDGSPMYTGVGHQKNDLGSMCMIAGIYLSWKILQKRSTAKTIEKVDVHDFVLIGMLLWLLRMSDSQTSTACLVTTVVLLLIARLPFISRKPSRIVAIIAVGALSFLVLDATAHIRDSILAVMGRDPSLTNRTELWDVVRQHEVNRFVGAGFMSFWTGERMEAIWDVLGHGINQAHNGYLEQYLNLGYVGVGFIAVIMLSALISVRKELDTDPSGGMLRLCLLVVAILFNYTEASFYGINNIWLLLLIASIGSCGSSSLSEASSGYLPPSADVAVRSVGFARPHRNIMASSERKIWNR